MLALLTAAALAGPLPDEGLSRRLPRADCTAHPQSGVAWTCPVQVDGVLMTTSLVAGPLRVRGVVILGVTTLDGVNRVALALQEAWGPASDAGGGTVVWRVGDLGAAMDVRPLEADLHEVTVLIRPLPRRARQRAAPPGA